MKLLKKMRHIPSVISLVNEVEQKNPGKVNTIFARQGLEGPDSQSNVYELLSLLALPELPVDTFNLIKDIEEYSPGTVSNVLRELKKGLHPEADEITQYNSAEALSTFVYPKYKFSDYSRIFLEDDDFLNYYKRFMDPNNWHSLDRKYTLNQLLKLIEDIPGDIVECGTYIGFSAYLMCQASLKTKRTVHLFDSFEGLSKPGEFDGSYWSEGRFLVPEDLVHQTLSEFKNYKVYKGWIPERFPEIADRKISFLHIDVDLYQPTLDSLSFFYDRIVPGGIILMDDYGVSTCPGAKKSADEFFAEKAENILLMTTGQGMVIKKS